MTEAKAMFDTYDIDGSGSICTTELMNALSSMGFMATAEQVRTHVHGYGVSCT